MLVFIISFLSYTWNALAINDDKIRETYPETTRFLLIQSTLNEMTRARAERTISFTGNTTRKTKGDNRLWGLR
ncbi:hypothetical protein BH18THE2_BH18THE2_08270 [soil metagenome]